jgi:hypothetical protein
MNWDTRFGKKLQGSLPGTKAFPPLRLNVEDVLPQQTPEDDHDDDFMFVTIFSKKSLNVSFCKKTKEYIGSFPEDTFQTLPPSHENLALLRELWLILFDRLALLYHKTLRKRLNADCVLDDNYIGCCNKISMQQWPPSVVITKQDQSPSPPEQPSPKPPPPPVQPPPNPPTPPPEQPPLKSIEICYSVLVNSSAHLS